MTDSQTSAEDLEKLHAQAQQVRVVVIGGGVAGLVAARECAKIGLHVTVVEAQDRLGGVVQGGEVAGITLDLGAESFATRGGHVRRLLAELGFAEAITAPDHSAGGAWLAGIPGVGAAPMPGGGVLGIPANPFAEDVRAVIGWRGAWRAYLDRLRPPLTIGHDHSLGHLVRSRLGARVRDRLVAPVTLGVYSAEPEVIDPDIAAPGLNSALTRVGSLTGAVAALAAKRTSAPGGAVEGIEGGLHRLITALVDDLHDQGVEIRTSSTVVAITENADGDARWRVDLAPTDADGDAAPPQALEADAIILATPEEQARALLGPLVPGLAATSEGRAPQVDIVTLVVDAPQLDSAPRGTGVLTVPGSYRAKALTHVSAKWPWVRGHLAPGHHIVRVSFGSQGEDPRTRSLSTDDAVDLALSEASAMLGVTITRAQLIDAAVASFRNAQPGSTIGRRQQTTSARAAIRAVPALAAVGAWLAGTGLAQVIPDAAAEAELVRRAALFGERSDEKSRERP